jgi:S-adenosylmethionine:tRNA ribosyltransferase-isomerase
MDTASFDYELPARAIAQEPASPRDSSRLLVVGDPVRHLLTGDFPTLVGPGDVVVLNETRVLRARLTLRKPTGGVVEVLALEPATGCAWQALVRPSRRVPPGTVLVDETGDPALRVDAATGTGSRIVTPVGRTMEELLEHWGAVPLPPYIEAPLADVERYQTVYAREPSSVAAPTAGLHMTPEALQACTEAGAEVHKVELSVGIGTFRPLEGEAVEGHTMHEERYRVPEAVWDACRGASRVVAVGTTVVRALESVASTGDLEGRTGLFITPGYDFAVVDAMLTNFHLPRSTLLVMLEAFMGPGWRSVYSLALAEGYRFLSFGDAMFVERPTASGRP